MLLFFRSEEEIGDELLYTFLRLQYSVMGFTIKRKSILYNTINLKLNYPNESKYLSNLKLSFVFGLETVIRFQIEDEYLQLVKFTNQQSWRIPGF